VSVTADSYAPGMSVGHLLPDVSAGLLIPLVTSCVRLMGPSSSAELQQVGASALHKLTCDPRAPGGAGPLGPRSAVVAARVVPPLVLLLGKTGALALQETALNLMGILAADLSVVPAMVKANARPALWRLLGQGTPAPLRRKAAFVLRLLCTDVDYLVTLVEVLSRTGL
jgi:hypothetical protein